MEVVKQYICKSGHKHKSYNAALKCERRKNNNQLAQRAKLNADRAAMLAYMLKVNDVPTNDIAMVLCISPQRVSHLIRAGRDLAFGVYPREAI